jgi:hypothetical protein
MRSWKGGCGLFVAVAISVGVLVSPAAASTEVYPAGGGGFSGDAEGWEVTSASCNVPALCSASGGYDGSDGRPAGSVKAETDVNLNLISLFESTVTLQSPDFEIEAGGAATLHLDRRFVSGALVDLDPRLDYTARLVDRTSGKRSTSISETIEGSSAWSGEDGATSVKAGHSYAILLTARTSSSVAGTGLLSGTTTARFDNVALTVDSDGTGSGREGAGGSGITDARLAALAPATVSGPAKLKGKRLFVKARCPSSVGRACRISVIGLLKKHRPATANRRFEIAKGKTKRVVLRVKPRAKGKLAARKRLLFKIRLRAGGAQATTVKRLRLIRR